MLYFDLLCKLVIWPTTCNINNQEYPVNDDTRQTTDEELVKTRVREKIKQKQGMIIHLKLTPEKCLG